jgi:hypothetical protein
VPYYGTLKRLPETTATISRYSFGGRRYSLTLSSGDLHDQLEEMQLAAHAARDDNLILPTRPVRRHDRLDGGIACAITADRLERRRDVLYVLGKVVDDKLLVQHPLPPRPETMTQAELEAIWDGNIILMTRRASLTDLSRRFDIGWFVGAVHKYRRLLSEVLVASFFLQIFALISPLFFQVIIDKVLVHRSMSWKQGIYRSSAKENIAVNFRRLKIAAVAMVTGINAALVNGAMSGDKTIAVTLHMSGRCDAVRCADIDAQRWRHRGLWAAPTNALIFSFAVGWARRTSPFRRSQGQTALP